MNKKLDNDVLEDIDLNNFEIEINIDRDIAEYMEEFSVDENDFNLIPIPMDIEKSAKLSFRQAKDKKRKNLQYKVLDVILVCIILLPIIGVIYPKVFVHSPKVYNVFEDINQFIQIDNLKSFLGIGKEVIEGSARSSRETIYIAEENIEKPTNNNEAIKLIHSLANTLVVAEYKWQCGEVTPKTINLALKGVEKIKDPYDRMHLRNSLEKWKDGDFSNSVDVHNYVWEMLDGSVGKAEELDKDKIQNILNKYY